MSPPRPQIDVTLGICSRTLNGEQSTAVQVANHHPINLSHPRTKQTIQRWAEELELEILIGFKIDPTRYEVRLHVHAPSDQPCPAGQEVRSLNYIDVSEMEHPVVEGTFEVHFVLRDNVKTPTVADLRDWQQRWAATTADPPSKTTFCLCSDPTRVMRLDIPNLLRPPKGNVEKTLRHGLGLTSTQDILKRNFSKAVSLDLTKKNVSFHLDSEQCEDRRDITALANGNIQPDDIVRLHVAPRPYSMP